MNLGLSGSPRIEPDRQMNKGLGSLRRLSNNGNSGGVDINSNNDPKLKRQIRELMEHYYTNHDGKLNASEILVLHNHLIRKQKQEQNLKIIALVLFIMLCLSVVANFGTAVASNVLTRVTRVKNTRMTSPTDGNTIVSTGKAFTNLPLYFVPFAGVTVVDQINYMRFTVLDVQLTTGHMIGNYSDLIMGLEVRSYFYFNLTSVLLRGSGSERLYINDGSVLAWGFEGMATGRMFPVCPGLGDTSHVKCSLVKASDVDLSALEAKAYRAGFPAASPTR